MRRVIAAIAYSALALAAADPVLGQSSAGLRQPIPGTKRAPPPTPHADTIPTDRISAESFGSDRIARRSQDVPPLEKLVALIRNTLGTVNDANRAQNYSVFYQLSSSEAQARSSPEILSESFRPIREQKVDLAILSVASPKFTQLPVVTPKGLLRLKGTFESSPTVNFDFFFQKEGKEWKIFAVGLGVVPVDSRPKSTHSDKSPAGKAP